MSPRKEVGLTKNGYLNKAPFHSENDGLIGKVKIQYFIDLLQVDSNGTGKKVVRRARKSVTASTSSRAQRESESELRIRL